MRNGIPSRLSQAELDELDANPPAWLRQSRENRTGKRPVWVKLTCEICGFSEDARPKKWWPNFTYLTCDYHNPQDLPDAAAGLSRTEVEGVGSRFIGIVDE